MRIALRVLGVELGAITIEPDETLVALSSGVDSSDDDDGDDEELIVRLGTSDHSFGFASDPAFPEFEWEEEE